MSDAVTTAFIAGGVSLVVGALSSLLAPWAQWGVDKRRETRAHRRALIASWRAGISEWEYLLSRGRGGHLDYGHEEWFMSLEPHLKPDAKHDTDGFLREVARLEREWGLT